MSVGIDQLERVYRQARADAKTEAQTTADQPTFAGALAVTYRPSAVASSEAYARKQAALQRSTWVLTVLGPPVIFPMLSSLGIDDYVEYAGLGLLALLVGYLLVRLIIHIVFPGKGMAQAAEEARRRNDLVIQRLHASATPTDLARAKSAMQDMVGQLKRRSEGTIALAGVVTACAAAWFFFSSGTNSTPTGSWGYVATTIAAALAVIGFRARRAEQQTSHFIYCLEEANKLKAEATPMPPPMLGMFPVRQSIRPK